jgi:hypothetical protein
LALCAAGCGGTDSGGGSCGDASGCGGDVVGNWKIAATCLKIVDATSDNATCPGMKTSADFKMSGTVAYNSDRTYHTNVTVDGTTVVNMPASCLTQQNVTITCAQLQQSFEGNATGTEFQSVSCSGSSDCTCTMKLTPEPQMEDGTYSVSGGTLTQTKTGGTADDSLFCVKGSTLTLSPTDSTSVLTGSVSLTKQ